MIVTTDLLASELRSLMKERAEAALDPAEFPCMTSLVGSGDGADSPTVHTVELQPLLDAAIAKVQDELARRSLESLLGSSSLRFQSVKERATTAARNSGVSYDAYRRKDTGRMTTDLYLLAQQLLAATVMIEPPDHGETSNGEPSIGEVGAGEVSATASVGAPPHSPSRRRSRSLVVGAIAAAVLIAAVAAVALRGSSDDLPEASTSSALPSSTTTPPQATATEAALDRSVSTEKPIAPACFNPGQTSSTDDEAVVISAAIAELAGDVPVSACGVEPMTKRGDVYWQRFKNDRRLIGGFIGFDHEGEVRAMFLNLGQWQSYMRVGGGDGSRSSNLAGFPTGQLIALGDLTSLAVTGDALLTAEDPAGTYYWMPKVASDVWLAQGGGDGPLGNPTSSVYIVEGSFRVDFEHGYLEQLMEGRLDTNLIDDAGAELLPLAEMSGRLISAFDGTGWFVDADGARWWIPDAERWDCAGGVDNMVLSGLPGYAIHSLPYGGVAGCPLHIATGTAPVAGPPFADFYCHDEFGAVAEQVDGALTCAGAEGSQPVDVATICRWQYGPTAVAKTEPDNASTIACHTS